MTMEEKKNQTSQEFNARFFDEVTNCKGFEAEDSNQYICILFDLLLYRYPELSKRVYGLIINFFLRKRVMIQALSNIQILESTKSKEILQEVKRCHKELNKLKNDTKLWLMSENDYGTESKQKVTAIFATFEKLCIIEDETVGSFSKPGDGMFDADKFGFRRKKDDFLLFDMPDIKVNKESQRLMRDFGIGEIALFFVK